MNLLGRDVDISFTPRQELTTNQWNYPHTPQTRGEKLTRHHVILLDDNWLIIQTGLIIVFYQRQKLFFAMTSNIAKDQLICLPFGVSFDLYILLN